jgi:hypothetical protein
LSVEEVYGLYKQYGKGIVDFIKGSFVLMLYNEQEHSALCVSDHLNVLPIYYAFKNQIFVFSSAIKPILDSGFVSDDLDRAAILEFAIFDYTLGKKTYYKNIKMLDYGMFLHIDGKGINEERYFSISTLFQRDLMTRKESLELLCTQLRENVNLYSSDKGKFLLSLTGGFDGRANLALLDRPRDDFLCYSYGMPGSLQVRVPMNIAERIGIQYRPIYLDRAFEKEYEDCALRSLFYSDGTAPVLRANYPFAYQRLSEFSDTAVTGLFGSEVLRPIRNLGIELNDNIEHLFLSDDFDRALRNILEREKEREYFQPILFSECSEELREYMWARYVKPYANVSNLVRFFFFFIEEGIRKYFMQEIRIERVYVTTRFPYLDFDMLWLLFKTPFAGLYNGALRQSPLGRRRAQSLYAHIIGKHKPELGDIMADRGYKPNDLLSPLWFLKILPGYLKTKMYYRKKGNDTFDAERWTDIVFSKNTALMSKETDMFPGKMARKYANGENLIDNYYFSRVFSLKYWLEKC